MVSAGFAAAALAEGVLVNGRFRNAFQWAAAHGRQGFSRYLLAAEILATHGRFVADEVVPRSFHSTIGGQPRIVVEGAEHLAGLEGVGGLLVNVHLGPPNVWPSLEAVGYPVHRVGIGETAVDSEQWAQSVAAGTAVTVSIGGAADRIETLYRMRQWLRQGALVAMSADGVGREAFRLDLAGGPMIIRAGWLSIRRAARVPTLPVFARADGQRMIITVHPPLPPPGPMMDDDVENCRRILLSLVADYLRRCPEQCRWLAMSGVERGVVA